MHEVIEVRNSQGEVSRIFIGDVIGMLPTLLPDTHVIVITDENIYKHYGILFDKFDRIIIGRGEEHKTLATAEHIYGKLLELGADRKSFILGFGGGIVTDIAGFAASTYMRGIRFGFVASTLLAQVDASVGGKNGVNLGGYKNIVGTFNQPEFVLCDTSLLDTLPDKEFRTGLSEIIKAGLIADPELFRLFEHHSSDDFRANKQLLTKIISRAVHVKADIVSRDEKEGGERKKLNLGHTLAHAIEKCSREFTHGEAVAIGTVFIGRLSHKMGLISEEELFRILNVISKAGLPSESSLDIDTLFEALKLDKKKENDSISLILMRGIGSCEIRRMGFDEFRKLI